MSHNQTALKVSIEHTSESSNLNLKNSDKMACLCSLTYLRSRQWRSQRGTQGAQPPPILQTKHKHTFKLKEIGQFVQLKII